MLINSNKTMSPKQFQITKLVFVFVLAFISSQALIFEIYILPLIVLIAISLLLMILRRRVKGIIADERDYALGGKAAMWAIQIYSWTAAVVMIVLYALRHTNALYEPVAMTLAFSTCLLMFSYAVIFRFLSRRLVLKAE